MAVMTQRVIKFPKEDPKKGSVLCPACGCDFECEYDMNIHFSRHHISASFRRSIRSVFKYGGKYLHL